MREPEDVQVMLSLHKRGWGSKRIARELGISRNTVRRYLSQGGWQPYGGGNRTGRLDGLEEWLEMKFEQHRGNAEVIRQELISEHSKEVSLRTVERAVAPFRRKAFAKAKATIRFETEPGRQLQIDFGSTKIYIDGNQRRVYLFVATLGYSRRIYVQAFTHERQSSWMRGLEGAFRHFEGVPKELLMDNPRALVKNHNPLTREITFNERFLAFTRYWKVAPRACAPYRARTKGKDERAVGYVKHNAIAGRTFPSWEALQSHLSSWNREIADLRIHGTTGEQPKERFLQEAKALQPIMGKPPFLQMRELRRSVHADACIEVDTNRYSVPWSLIGESVQVEVSESTVRVIHKGVEVCSHPELLGQRLTSISATHLAGIVGAHSASTERPSFRLAAGGVPKPQLLRPLSEYAAVAGGSW